MAIDKSLPNKKVEIPGQQEQIEEQIEIREELPDPIVTGKQYCNQYSSLLIVVLI